MRTLSAVFVLSVVFLAGCFTADVTINDDGSGKIDVTYDPMLPVKEAGERKNMSGSGLTLEELKISEQGEGQKKKQSVHAVVKFEDLSKLKNSKKLRRFHATIKDGAEGTKELTVILTRKVNKGFAHAQPVTIRIHLPGDVVETSAEKKDNRTVVWSFPAAKLFPPEEMKMTARYRVAAAAAAEPAKTDAAEANTGEKQPEKKDEKKEAN